MSVGVLGAEPRRRLVPSGARARLAVSAAQAVSRGSRLWRQRGLGTIFSKLYGLSALRTVECTVEFRPGCVFRLPVFEPYWGPTIVGGRPYEPEVVRLLHDMSDLAPVFVDCGANFGYFSVLVTGPEFRYAGAIAIEANPTTVSRLRENARLNGDRFQCLAFALAARSGETVQLAASEHHAVAHVREHEDEAKGLVDVETVCIDDAVERTGLGGHERYVLKLDVEGQEIAALEGSRKLRAAKDHLVVYEDWADAEFSTTTALLDEGYPVFFVRTDGTCRELTSIAAARSVVAADGEISRACNFAAVKRGGAFHTRLAGSTR